MTVKQLISKLSELDDDTEVIMAADEEGNYYAPLRVVEITDAYKPAVLLWPGCPMEL